MNKVTPHAFALGTPDPLEWTRGVSYTISPEALDQLLDGNPIPSAAASYNILPPEKSDAICKINNKFDTHVEHIKAIKLAQPVVVWSERVIKVLTLAAICVGSTACVIGTAHLIVPLIFIGGFLGIYLLAYLNMRNDISSDAEALAEKQRDECVRSARSNPKKALERFNNYLSDPLSQSPSPRKSRKPPTIAKECSDAYNEFLNQQAIHTGQWGLGL